MRVPHIALKLLAAATWYVGAGVLIYKGAGYLVSAFGAGAALPPVVSGLLGLIVGLVRGRTMFLKACRRNLTRIDALERPRIWQFFRPGFFAALLLMFAAGAVLAWLAGLGYWGRVVVGGLELVIGAALLTSSTAFWEGDTKRATFAGEAAVSGEEPSPREGPTEVPPREQSREPSSRKIGTEAGPEAAAS